jgi:leucyl aminopeptidase
MKFEIKLYADELVNSISWCLSNEYSITCQIPLSYYAISDKNREINYNLVRNSGASIHQFLIQLNKAYHRKKKFNNVTICLKNKGKASVILDSFLEGFYLANYEFNTHKTVSISNMFEIKTQFSDEMTWATSLGTYIARDLVNEPLSHLNAEIFSKKVKTLGKDAGFKVDVLDEQKIKELKMGGVLNVNKGSVTKPTFNILTFKSKNSKNDRPIVLVGKGVMYDTGGLSLKSTPNSMDMMKCDMGGAAAVVGTIYALAKSKTDCYVIGLVPAVENRPGGDAYVPGDIITMMSGKTVEVLNTDAEGRLILADALHYAKRFKPKLVIDIATLTGSASRCTGKYGAVCMENYNKEIFGDFSDSMKLLISIGNYVGERLVVQPFWDEYKNELDSSVADITNLGGAESGHITAGKFLEQFVDYPWIHIDIAGVAFLKTCYLYNKKGGTGFGVRVLSQFIKHSS